MAYFLNMPRWWIFILGLLLFGLALAEQVPTHDLFRVTITTSRSASRPGAWRYLIAPRTKLAKKYWEFLTGEWIRALRFGLPVKLGPVEVRVRGKELELRPGCERFQPRCYTKTRVPEGFEEWMIDLVIIDFHNTFTWALEDARKRAREYPSTVSLSKFLRIYVDRRGPISAEPLGWKP